MRLDRFFDQPVTPTIVPAGGAEALPMSFACCHFGMAGPGQWGAIYRVAYERTVEALWPTRYDRALVASAN